jgi:hypothetical protein
MGKEVISIAQGREKLLSLGVYDPSDSESVALSKARERHDKSRATLNSGLDPSQECKNAKRESLLNAENTFEANDVSTISESYANNPRSFQVRRQGSGRKTQHGTPFICPILPKTG